MTCGMWSNGDLQEHGLRDLPTAVYPDRKEGVTLCCTRDQEAVSYTYGGEEGIAAIDRLEELCKVIPVHVIYGGNADIMCASLHSLLLWVADDLLFHSP